MNTDKSKTQEEPERTGTRSPGFPSRDRNRFNPCLSVYIRGSKLKPIAAVGNPPTEAHDRDGGAQGPPERQRQVRNQAHQAKQGPENLLLHLIILSRTTCNKAERRGKSNRPAPNAARTLSSAEWSSSIRSGCAGEHCRNPDLPRSGGKSAPRRASRASPAFAEHAHRPR